MSLLDAAFEFNIPNSNIQNSIQHNFKNHNSLCNSARPYKFSSLDLVFYCVNCFSLWLNFIEISLASWLIVWEKKVDSIKSELSIIDQMNGCWNLISVVEARDIYSEINWVEIFKFRLISPKVWSFCHHLLI